jgi:hypothetical protein
MTVLQDQPTTSLGRATRLVVGVLLGTVTVVVTNLGKAARPGIAHLTAHGYALLGLGFIDAAAFTHSLFAGLLVTGISWLVFEWKASE